MIERQIGRPSPRPLDLVVWKGSKRRSSVAGGDVWSGHANLPVPFHNLSFCEPDQSFARLATQPLRQQIGATFSRGMILADCTHEQLVRCLPWTAVVQSCRITVGHQLFKGGSPQALPSNIRSAKR
jgi:hypothetical protein